MQKVNKSNGLVQAIQVNDAGIRSHLDQRVRDSVEQTLNSHLDAEADQVCRAWRYERSWPAA
jgi:hypothetical protein